jgi:hypothetical protein
VLRWTCKESIKRLVPNVFKLMNLTGRDRKAVASANRKNVGPEDLSILCQISKTHLSASGDNVVILRSLAVEMRAQPSSSVDLCAIKAEIIVACESSKLNPYGAVQMLFGEDVIQVV